MKNYEKIHPWELYSKELVTEYNQSIDEGLDIEQYKEFIYSASRLPADDNKEKIADAIFNIISSAPTRADYKYIEPSDLEGIRALCKKHPIKKVRLGKRALKNKTQGAWFGRIAGCLLGKPIEGRWKEDIWDILKGSKNYPLTRYIEIRDMSEEILTSRPQLKGKCFIDNLHGYVPFDDDTNYMVLAKEVIRRYGRDFTPYQMTLAWLDLQPKNSYCTAERIAFINATNGLVPPYTATYKNVYREWIGAQIRGDYFGYINPQNPRLAAEMGWRDASISHIKNGIYGEMWACAMIASAYSTNNIEDIIRAGLGEIPSTSRLYEAIDEVINDYNSGVTKEDALKKLYSRWNDHESHHWCHTISNAIVVSISLLYGEGDFTKSICTAVEAGFDTDCNGATVGSIVGIINGYDGIPKQWIEPLNNTLETTIIGYNKVKITDCVEETLTHTK